MVFRLDSAKTTYAFRVNGTGHLEHLYYGPHLRADADLEVLSPAKKNSIGDGISYSEENYGTFLEILPQETSTIGKGDYRSPAVDLVYGDGLRTLDFVFSDHVWLDGNPVPNSGLAHSYSTEKEASTLVIEMKDKVLPIYMHLYYTVFHSCNVISRLVVLDNRTESPLTINNLASMQLDLIDSDWDLVSFDGAWARERYCNRRKVQAGKTILSSNMGTSGSSHNPFFMLERPDTDSFSGACYGFNLVYSGDYSTVVEKSPYGMIRVQNGLNPDTFTWTLNPGERFITPEAVVSFSNEGTNDLSKNFHTFIASHIVRGSWKHQEKPVVFNSWEAVYFDYNERKIIELARRARDIGAEIFVLDDGWFGHRNSATESLGDWLVNTEKLPSGLGSLSSKIHKMGMKFGLWVEPEMVSRQSNLYGQHPDWAVTIPDREPSIGRHQFVLDLTRKDVQDYIVTSMTRVFSDSQADYIKWDMNRTISDVYSINGSSAFNYRYIKGLYSIMSRLTEAFPEVLFEGCASGGNRFDLGILCFMPQIWTSDNTDAWCRTKIQEGTSYGYGLQNMAAHVTTAPNHQTLRQTDLESRFNVAAFGVLGYELDLDQLDSKKTEIIRNQVDFYKQYRPLIQNGTFYRLPATHGMAERTLWAVADTLIENILVLDFQRENIANSSREVLIIPFADSEYLYEVTSRTDSKFCVRVTGDILNSCGLPLPERFGGTGCAEGTDVLGDFDSKLYIIKKVNNK